MSDRRIFVDYIARTEGDGAIDIIIGPNGELKKARWEVWEPPRFFEAFLIGRKYDEIPEMVQRICGICPHGHHLAAVRAVERAMGVKVSLQTTLLRELLHYGDWIQSLTLHVYCLAAPDYLGYESVLAMAGNEELLPVVKQALSLKRLGNDISVLIQGNEIQNRTSVVGGFTAVPSGSELKKIQERLKEAKDFTLATVRLAAKIASQDPYPELVRKCEHVSLREEGKYPINGGRLVSTEGLDVPDWEYPEWLIEKHVPGCNCKHAIVKGRDSFLVGPLARVNNNFDLLSKDAQAIAKEVGFSVPSFNPFHSIIARGIELVHSIDTAIELIDEIGDPVYEEPKYEIKAGEGYAITEAARGICCHGGKIDKDGVCQAWDIVAPTSRNVYNLEKDFESFVPKLLNLSDEELTLKCEMMIRNYDPCQSCATHSIKVNLRREG
ncbi:MAG: Ni/Fe hydrogenase subunit alpha [Thermacetogeniaceae bacterium]|jgi:coenzyme F420-reducing hydrogenase alpha subunit|nr:Ni/Fe hydrogenase subunit alpha [Thermoanaerobacterales bacterium]NLN22000.1 Ni/Fe hydrogenase subunit alpha [Syntrophomonadaceae bacterium]HAF16788.1 Ni/Fe hydrogenase subunit alpha [Peptococcaceae bacterium]